MLRFRLTVQTFYEFRKKSGLGFSGKTFEKSSLPRCRAVGCAFTPCVGVFFLPPFHQVIKSGDLSKALDRITASEETLC